MPTRKPPVPEDLTTEQKRALLRWAKQHAPELSDPKDLRFVVDETLDYHRATENARGYRDWFAVCRNRLRFMHRFGYDVHYNRSGKSMNKTESEVMNEATRKAQAEAERYKEERKQFELEAMRDDEDSCA